MNKLEPVVDHGSSVPIEDQLNRLIEIAVGPEPVPPVDEQLLRRVSQEKSAPPAQQTLPLTDDQTLKQTLPQLAPSPLPSLRKSIKRLVRPALGIGLLGLAIWSLAPLLFDVRSKHAVVNAPVVIVRSPIDGMVRFLCQTASGANAVANTPLLDVNNSLADNDRMDVLEDEKALLEARLQGLRQQLENLSTLQDNLLTTTHKYKEARLRTLDLERDGAKSLVESAQSIEKQRVAEEEMLDELRKNRSVSVQDANASHFAAEAARHSVVQSQKNVENLEEQIRALKDGVHVGPSDGRNDLPYSAQRLHELSFRMEEIRASIQEDEAKLAQLLRHISAEEERRDLRSQFTAKSPVDWIVWRRHVVSGTAVKADSPLLDLIDPTEVFVDAVISEGDLSKVHLGDTAHVRISGSDKDWKAVVKQVVGHGLPWPDRLLAAEAIPTSKRQEVHVILSFSEPISNGEGAIMVPIGLPAEVTFVSTADYFKKLFMCGGL
jgi:multidrug resistance efflux pump